jgi:hypothetical protein
MPDHNVYAPGKRERTFTGAERSNSKVNGDQRRAARSVDRNIRAAQVELIG